MEFTWVIGNKIIQRGRRPHSIRYWKLDDDYFLEIQELFYPKGPQYHLWNKMSNLNLVAFLGTFRTLEDAQEAAGKKFKIAKGLPKDS